MASGDSSKDVDGVINSPVSPASDVGYYTRDGDKDYSHRSDDLSLVDLAEELNESDSLVPSQLTIPVRTADDQLHTIAVRSSGQVKDLKDEIEKELGMPSKTQHLLLDNLELHNEQRLSSYQWSSTSFVSVYEIVVVHVTTANETLLEFSLDASAAIADVKGHIFSQLKIPKNRQILYLADSIVDDNRQLNEFSRFLFSFRLFLSLYVGVISGQMINLEVDIASTVKDVKKMLEQSEGLPPHKQRIVYNSKVLNDTDKLQELGIHKNPLCHLVPMDIEVHIKKPFDDMPIGSVMLSTSNTVNDIKAKVAHELGIAVHRQQHFLFAGRKLEDGVQLFNYKIKEGSTLILAINTEISITLRTSDGSTYVIEVDPTSAISNAKSKMEEEHEFPAVQQIWKLFGQQLDNEKTVAECNITADQVVHIEMLAAPRVKLLVCNIAMQKITLDDLFTTSSIPDVKRSIQKMTKILPSQQVLIYNGEKLAEDSSLLGCFIGTNSTLFLHELPFSPSDAENIQSLNSEGILLLRSENEMLKKALAESEKRRAEDNERNEREIKALQEESLDSQKQTAEVKTGLENTNELAKRNYEATTKLSDGQETLERRSDAHEEDMKKVKSLLDLPSQDGTQSTS